MNTQSPKDGYVTQLKFADGAQVTAGAPVLVLDSVSEDLRIARINALEQLRAIFAERLSARGVQIAQSLAQIPTQIADRAVPQLQEILNETTAGEFLGTQPAGTSNILKNQILTVQAQGDQGVNDLALTNINLNLSNTVNNILQLHLKSELNTATLLKNRVTIVAQAPGKVNYLVEVGLFVRRGQTLLDIT